ncbi:extracellular solute-binding protein [Propionibacteriaceae bacterium G1746]|uniref:extracellular solute-binding protein n=1 Tax=Aestuariimicrobium sp. G57 TaxID=3418485 RepID=UPI003C2484B7
MQTSMGSQLGRRGFLAGSVVTGLGLAGCGLQSAGDQTATKLTIYSPRPKAITDHVIAEFKRAHTQYDVQLLTLGAAEVADRIRAEKANPQADVWWGGTPSIFGAAVKDDLVAAFPEAVTGLVPDKFHGEDKLWLAEMQQLQLFIYNHDMIKEAEVPNDWADLIDPRYKNKFIIRDVAASGTMRGIYSSIIYQYYKTDKLPDAGYDFLRKFDANTVDYAANPEQLYLRLTRQEAPLSLWNHQDTLTQAKGGAPFSIKVPASGACLNLDGIARVKGGRNEQGAVDFATFVLSDGMQTWLAENAFQIPTREIASKPEWLSRIEVKELPVDRTVLAAKEKEWTTYWVSNIKNQG